MNKSEYKRRWQLMMKDIGVALLQRYKENFENKAFFDKKWKPEKYPGAGSLMIKSGRLRRSLKCKRTLTSLTFTSDAPYASIHNEGGVIVQKPTKLQREFYWGKFRETKNPMYKASALAKEVRIPIPQRQFIGYHKDIDKIVERCAKDMVEDVMVKMFKV